jgi:tRNA threonylcarbamoyladenosine biosynthesis protein TsaB
MLLALETATEFGGVALLEGRRVLFERDLDPEMPRAGSLLAAVDDVLKHASLPLEAIDMIALSIGPGSFTGLRVGLATALGLCFGAPRKIVPVPTLAALSLQAGDATRIVPLLDARKKQVYTGLYGGGGVSIREDRVCDPEPWFQELRDEGPLHLLGPGAQLYRKAAVTTLGNNACLLAAELGRPRASSVGRLGARLAEETGAIAPETVALRYLRRAEAEEKRGAGHPFQKPIV